MSTYRALCFFASILPVFSIPINPYTSRSTFVIHEKRQVSPPNYQSHGPADPSDILNIHVGLKSSNLSGLEEALYNASTLGSPGYGKYLTKEQVEAFAAPTAETRFVVEQWLQENGITPTNVSHAQDWLGFSVNVSKANELFDANYHLFSHIVSGQQLIRTMKVSLPVSVAGHVEVVYPATDFPPTRNGPVSLTSNNRNIAAPSSRAKRSSDSLTSLCNGSAPPACLQALYGILPTVGTQNESRIAVTGLDNQIPQTADFKLFLETFRTDLDSDLGFSFQALDGSQNIQNSSNYNGEANLDIQYTAGLAGGVPAQFMSVGPDTHNGLNLVDLVLSLLADDNPPQVMTTSYGFDEPDGIPASLAIKYCNTVMQLTARGVTVINSSGDGGVAGNGQRSCTTFVPTFPSTCPFVTSVGATEGFSLEAAAALSGGGFSNLFARPSYQDIAVQTYLEQLGSTYTGLFNNTGRAYPDVSAQGIVIPVINGGQTKLSDGTSSSAPIFASIIGQINAIRLGEGKGVLGFINPVIYARSDLLQDITLGSNPGCNTDGFTAMPGWDPLTGLGTPIFTRFRNLP